MTETRTIKIAIVEDLREIREGLARTHQCHARLSLHGSLRLDGRGAREDSE